MKLFIWSNGEKPEKSYKKDKLDKKDNTIAIALDDNNVHHTNLSFTDASHIEKESLRYRDEANNKLNMRYMVQQVSQNPFLQGTNYIDDLDNQERYLRPKQQK
jgi:hypothetical protein